VADALPSVPDAAAPAPADLAAVDAADPAAAASALDCLGEGNGPAAPDEHAPSRAHALLASTDAQRSPNGYPTLAAIETQALRRRQQRLYVRIVIFFGALLLIFSMVLATVARHLEPGAVPSAALSWARANLEHVDAATVATVGREAAVNVNAERAPSARHGARATARTHATSGGSDARGQSGRQAPKQLSPSPKPTPPPSRPPPPSQPPPQPQRPPTQPQQPQARASEGTAKAQQPTPAESGRPAASPREASARDGAGRTSPSTGERNGFTEAFPRRRLLRTVRVLLNDMRTWYSWSL
jgi:outer membrane biosynthesis protein TonB